MDYVTLFVKILYSKNDLTSERSQQLGWYSSVRELGQQIAHILEERFSHKAKMSSMLDTGSDEHVIRGIIAIQGSKKINGASLSTWS